MTQRDASGKCDANGHERAPLTLTAADRTPEQMRWCGARAPIGREEELATIGAERDVADLK